MQPVSLLDEVTVDHFRSPAGGPREIQYVTCDDRYALRLPLRPGRITVLSDGKPLHDGSVLPGMMRVESPGEEVRVTLLSAWDAAIVSIPAARLRSTVQALRPLCNSHPTGHIKQMMQPRFQVEQLGHMALHATAFDPTHARLLLDGVTDSLLAFLFFQRGVSGEGNKPTKGLLPGEFRRVVDFAEAHLQDTLKLDAWAEVLNMSAPEFTRRFRVTTGASPYAWFMRRRIDRAKELLRATPEAIGYIAFSVGFCSQSHFTDAFSRQVGTSPARWRQDQAPGRILIDRRSVEDTSRRVT